MSTIRFQDRKASIDFYQTRYEGGYMGHWSAFDKKRLFDLVKSLSLPATGTALDFGCGRGIFTEVIRTALPGWKIFGCDISREAIRDASGSNPNIPFFVLGDGAYKNHKFDFIHSHHVLEHTYDATITAAEMSSFAADRCMMLHSLPCNHEGSLEYNLAKYTRNGFDPNNGKFFFEDSAHLRRLNVAQAEDLFSKHGFAIFRKYFANQYWGALKWISESTFSLVWNIATPLRANSMSAFFKLLGWRIVLLLLWFCSFTSTAFKPADRGPYYSLKKIIRFVLFVFFFWLVIPVTVLISSMAKKEWDEQKESPRGTDMFLIFIR